MKLVVNGCSNSVATIEGIDYSDKCWGYFLSKHLDLEFINLSIRAGSLERILRTTIEYFSKNEKGFYVVGLPGGPIRWEIHSNYSGWIQKGIQKDNLTNEDKLLVSDNTTTYWWIKHYIYFISLQSFLKENKIPYLVFNSGTAFNTDIKYDQYAKYIDEKYFIGKYNSFEEGMTGYLNKKGYKQDYDYHFYEDGQKDWASYLYEKIVSMKQTEN